MYARVRDPGFEWLGEVPEHWQTTRLAYSALRSDVKLEPDQAEGLPYVGLEHVASWTGRLLPLDDQMTPEGAANAFESGDVLFGKLRPYLAKAVCADFDGVCSAEFLVLKSRDYERRYLLYLLLTDGFISHVDSSTYGAKMPRASWDFIGDSLLPVPPLDEQRDIADFLDQETERIDSLIAKKRLLIERLQEYRTALITRTVTRGLPAEAARAAGLDPSLRLKPSGVEWLGDVPEHWQVARLKWSRAAAVNGVWGEEPDGENDIPCVRVADFDRQSFRVRFAEPTMRSVVAAKRDGRELRPGDLLLEKSGGGEHQLVGCVVLFDHEQTAVCSNFISRVSPAEGAYPGYWMYAHAALYAGRLNYPAVKQTTGIQNLDADAYFDTLFVFPPHLEQKQIAEFLDGETSRIDGLLNRVEVAIERLHEYRTALITAAVTGKIDVRDDANSGRGSVESGP